MLKPRIAVVASMILGAALLRLLPHLPNASPIAALALFGGASFADRRLAFLVPLSALLASDLLLGLHSTMAFVYASFAATVCIGFWLRSRKTLLTVMGATLASSLLFFAVTNFGTWLVQDMYPKTFDGLFACYVAAIPFFRNTFAGDLLYSAMLFGGLYLAERVLPAIREDAAGQALTA
ncbi:MAG: hypothetical protein JOZ55_01185 [Alphaproteobacteria bacterium]|nr:hypothetical protein [Alphaproteobacteria bacterium]